MKHRLNLLVPTLLASLWLAGCAGNPPLPDAASDSPANPHAPPSPYPRFETGLLNLTNDVVPASGNAPRVPDHDHDRRHINP